MDNISARKIFSEFYNKTEKRFGQNFLFDEKINHKIVGAAGSLEGKIVAEIGPGPGGLTLEILKQNINKLYLIEFDSRWAEVWRNLGRNFDDKLEVIGCDALAFDFKSIAPNIIISNLPYNISTQLLFKWFPEFDSYEQLVLMFQKEVAERLYAKPRTKAYGKLSVLAQWKSQVSRCFYLEPGSFSPPPKVQSAVVKFVPFEKRENSEAEKYLTFSNLLTEVFSHRRKIVAKSLKKFFSFPEQVLSSLGYEKNVRAEELSVADYIKMLEFLK